MITKEQLDEYIRAYSQGKSLISDEEYDRLLEEYLRENGEDKRPFLRQKQTESVKNLVGTLKKVYGVTTPMRPEQDTYQNWLIRKRINPDSRIIIQPKFDGCSVAMDQYGNFFTRGDYDNGESVDVTELFKEHDVSKYINSSFEAVKFEAILCHENFHGPYFEDYNKPLDAVNAIIHSRNKELSKYITLVPLRTSIGKDEWICSELESLSVVTATAGDLDCIEQFITDKLNDGAKVEYNGLHYSIDGVVVSVLDKDNTTQEEIAIKILNDINETTLIDVQFQFGKTGKITPVAIVEPVLFCDGKRTVDHITVSTLDRVNELGLRKGDTVRVMYNIVPYLLDTAHDGSTRIQLPTHCPKCGAPFEYTSLKTVRCTNPICEGRKLGSIIRYCEKMKMMGVGEATIERFFNEGLIRDIPDLYEITSNDIVKISGFREASANNIINAITKASTDIPVARWLGALPFLDVDSKKWDMLLNSIIGNDEMKKSNIVRHIVLESPEEFGELLLTKVKGLGPATIKAMNEGWMTNLDMMKKIINNISFRITTSKGSVDKICLSGTRDRNVINHLISKGYDVVDNFTRDVKYLVIPDKSFTSSKISKAEKLGIKILTIEEAMGL